MILKSIMLMVLMLALSSCQKESEQPSQSVLQWEPAFKNPRKHTLPGTTFTQFIASPKRSGHEINVVSGFDKIENLSKEVQLKVERAWRDGDKRNFIVILDNTSGKGTRVNFYVFSYDERGLLIDAKQEEVFFNPHESKFRRFEFSDSSKAKSWSLSVK